MLQRIPPISDNTHSCIRSYVLCILSDGGVDCSIARLRIGHVTFL